ncbi:MAG: hypothetical protein HY880_08625 [Deltaproteobacteria bacterium]|nr:hypothetical protein [Deltaproteobacteria bacterium]
MIYFKQLAKALVFSFAIANLIFAFRMDYTWLSVFASDLKLLSGKSAAEKTVILDGMDLYDFIEFVKMTIPPGEKIRDMEDEVEWHKISFNRPDRSQKDYLKFQMLKLSRFYLLPRLVSSKGRFALVYNDPDVFYDRDNNILGMKDISFRARPYGIYGKDALIFEIMEDL